MIPIVLTLAVANLLCVVAWILYAADEPAGGLAELAPVLRIIAVFVFLLVFAVAGSLMVGFLVAAELHEKAQRARRMRPATGAR